MTDTREVRAGQVWDIAHTRKGSFTVDFAGDHYLDAPDEWVSGVILEGRAKYLSAENRMLGAGETGEPITMRASFVTLLKRRPELETVRSLKETTTMTDQRFHEDVAAVASGGKSAFLEWWKANQKQFPTHQFARAEFDRLQRESEPTSAMLDAGAAALQDGYFANPRSIAGRVYRAMVAALA